MAIKCPKCQTDNPSDSKYCRECAAPLTRYPEKPDISVTKTMEEATAEFTRGTVFAGRYEIIEELGTGGMGSVYKAEDTKIRQEVALKLIRPEIASSRKTIERFRNEIKTARMIAHRNVCRMFDLGEEKGAYFISDKFDGEMGEIFDIQDRIASTIVSRMNVELLGDDRERVEKRYTSSQEAYDLHIKANYIAQRLTRNDDIHTAISNYFQEESPRTDRSHVVLPLEPLRRPTLASVRSDCASPPSSKKSD